MNLTSDRLSDSTIEQARRVDLLALCEQRYGAMRKNAQHDWQGKCPKCGTDYFHVYQTAAVWKFRCYECHDAPGDGIELIRWMQPGLNFLEAVDQLVGGMLPAATQRAPERIRSTTQAISPDWQNKAAKMVQNAQERLLGADGEPGQEYLASRGLAVHTWMQFGLGYRADASVPATEGKQKAPAIVMPWYAGGKLVGVRYRFFIEQNGSKLAAEYGSQFAGRLFGGQGLPAWLSLAKRDGDDCESLGSLVICEGEINAMSIWQTAHDTNLHVLSMGSESQKLTEAMVAFAKRYRNVIVWADRAEVARNLQAAIPSSSSLVSPNGKDANDLMRDGLLGAVLSMARLRACCNDGDRKGLLLDLLESARTWIGVDVGTVQAIQKIANDLGKTIDPIRPGLSYA